MPRLLYSRDLYLLEEASLEQVLWKFSSVVQSSYFKISFLPIYNFCKLANS